MKKLLLLLPAFIFTFSASMANYWTQCASLPADDRGAAAGFALNGYGYLGTGIKFGGPNQFHNDFWQYDPASNSWTQKTSFAGTPRSAGVGFSLLGKGYIACGYDGNQPSKELWQYDDVLDSWTQMANLPGPGRDYTVAFAIDSLAYIGTGYNTSGTSYQDFWQFSPTLNSWTQKANVSGITRSSALGFAAGGKGYIGGGYKSTYLNDFWQYDPQVNIWSQKADIPPSGRTDGTAFVINGYGYVLTGELGTTAVNDLWLYDHINNTWTQKQNLTGAARTNAVAFCIDNKGYIGTGWTITLASMNDFWEYSPDSTTGIAEPIIFKNNFEVYPNPANDYISIQSASSSDSDAEIYNVTGKILCITTHQRTIDISLLPKGVYYIRLNGVSKKFVKI